MLHFLNELDAGDVDAVRLLANLYNGLFISGLVLLAAVLIPAFLSAKVTRMRIWYAVNISLMWYCASFLLLMGRQIGPDPPFELCVIQAALTYAAPTLVSSYALALSIELFLRVSQVMIVEPTAPPPLVFMILPPVIYLSVFLEALLLGLQAKETVARDATQMYCHISTGIPSIVSAAVALLEEAVMLVFEVWVGMIMYRKWTAFKALHINGTRGAIQPSLFIRKSAYTVYICIATGLSAFVFSPKSASPIWAILLTTPPLAAAFLFGTQRDIVAFWTPNFLFQGMRRRKEQPSREPIEIRVLRNKAENNISFINMV